MHLCVIAHHVQSDDKEGRAYYGAAILERISE